MNKKGAVPVVMLVIFGIMTAIVSHGVTETSQNGVLKSNGKVIWCKMQNKDATYCDSLATPAP